MSKYRCPMCGAPHKEPQEQCRLCGAHMLDPSMIPTNMAAPHQAEEFDRYRPRSMAPFILGGLALVVVLAIGAIALGVVETDESVDDLRNKIDPRDQEDGWVEFEEPNGIFVAELPGTVEAVDGDYELTDGGTTTTYRAVITDQLAITIAYTDGVSLDDSEGTLETLQPVADQIAGFYGVDLTGDPDETTHDGRPAIDFRIDDLTVDGIPRTVNGRAVLLDDGNVLAVVTISDDTEPVPEQHVRVLKGLNLDPEPTSDDTAG